MTVVLSLFPGVELLDRAFRERGFCVVSGPDRITGGDVRDFHVPAGVFSGVIGGPPCQTFSALANLVRARGFEPRFGNLIPEFERVVSEAMPRWFLMENVPAAPAAKVAGYGVHDFVYCNSEIAGEDGIGQEQERRRRFSFGLRGGPAVDLRRWIPMPERLLPRAERVPAVLSDQRAIPVALGGSGKPKSWRVGTVSSSPVDNSPEAKGRRGRTRQPTITGAHQCGHRPNGGRGERRSLAEMCRLQGLPEDYLDDCPFTADAKRRLVANAVPMLMGLALAGAVRQALETIDAS